MLVLHHDGLAAYVPLKQPVHRIRNGVPPVNPLDDRGSVLGASGGLPEFLDLPGLVCSVGVDSFEPKWTVHNNFPVSKRLVPEYLGLLTLLERQERLAYPLYVLVRQFAVLLSQVPSQRSKPLARVY